MIQNELMKISMMELERRQEREEEEMVCFSIEISALLLPITSAQSCQWRHEVVAPPLSEIFRIHTFKLWVS